MGTLQMVKQTTRKDDRKNDRHQVGTVNPKNQRVIKDDKSVQWAKQPKVRVTFQLSVDLIERVRDVVFYTPGLTMTKLLTDALVTTLEKVELENGGRFASRGNIPLRTGRPVRVT